MATQVFEQSRRIYMADCDAGGIVFHPQYFVMITELMEDFYRNAGFTFKDGFESGLNFPIGGIRCDFCRPSVLGHLVTMRLWVEHIGTTSFRFAIEIVGDDGARVRCAETVVCVKTGPEFGALTKHPVPDELRAVLEQYKGEPLTLRA